jgi:uncharacterized FlgJ-related protein
MQWTSYIKNIFQKRRKMTNQEIGQLIYTTAFQDGMPAQLCSLIEAQSKHETDDYSSHAFINNNNCFGYKYVVGARWQSGMGITSSEGDHYAHYDDIQDSVHEICAWIIRRRTQGKFPADLNDIQTPTEYATLLKQCGYFGDPLQNYVSGLTHFLNNAA